MSNTINTVVRNIAVHVSFKARIALAVGALGIAVALGHVAQAAPLPEHPCTPALNQLLADWNAAGFEMPSKPGQAIVHGRNGRIASGGEVNGMASQIRQAIVDCEHGNVTAVKAEVARVEVELRAG
jgi:hypothetical protein